MVTERAQHRPSQARDSTGVAAQCAKLWRQTDEVIIIEANLLKCRQGCHGGEAPHAAEVDEKVVVEVQAAKIHCMADAGYPCVKTCTWLRCRRHALRGELPKAGDTNLDAAAPTVASPNLQGRERSLGRASSFGCADKWRAHLCQILHWGLLDSYTLEYK